MALVNARNGLLGYKDPNAQVEAPFEMPEPKQPATSGGNALLSSPQFKFQDPTPQPKKPGALMRGVSAFAEGFAPEQFEAGRNRARQDLSGQVAAMKEKMGKAMAWTQQALQYPDDQQAQAFIEQNAEAMERDTGFRPQFSGRAQMEAELKQLQAGLGIAPEKLTPYQQAQIGIEQQKLQAAGDKPEARQPLPTGMVYDEAGTPVWIDGYREGYRDVHPVKPSGGRDGLSDYQALNFQFKLDDLDRELAAAEKKRSSDLATVNSSIALLDDYLAPENAKRFNEVYGNWINPTGEGNDLLNPRVTPGSDRANGMAILEQVGGRAFLDSIAAMRGTGPLSDREGSRVTAAATRLTQATQSDEAAREAGKEFRESLAAYKIALEKDIENSRVAEKARRAQMQAMMGREQPADYEAMINEAFGPDDEDEDDVSDLLEKYK